jgi:hypothetical protein
MLSLGGQMRIVLSSDVADRIVAREYVDDGLEGEFVLTPDGSVVYRHPAVRDMFANGSRAGFVECARAWERYRANVITADGEAEQLRVVEELMRDLAAHDALREGAFWTNVSQQAAFGHL